MVNYDHFREGPASSALWDASSLEETLESIGPVGAERSFRLGVSSKLRIERSGPQLIDLEVTAAAQPEAHLPLTVRTYWFTLDAFGDEEYLARRDEHLRVRAAAVKHYHTPILRALSEDFGTVLESAAYWNTKSDLHTPLGELRTRISNIVSGGGVLRNLRLAADEINEQLFSWGVVERAAGFLEQVYQRERHSPPGQTDLGTQAQDVYRTVRKIASRAGEELKATAGALTRLAAPYSLHFGRVPDWLVTPPGVLTPEGAIDQEILRNCWVPGRNTRVQSKQA